MADTFTQIYIQVIFGAENRESNIPKNQKKFVHKFELKNHNLFEENFFLKMNNNDIKKKIIL